MYPAGAYERLMDAGLVASPDQDVDVVVPSSEPTDPQVDSPAAEEPVLQTCRLESARSVSDHGQSSAVVTRLLLRHGPLKRARARVYERSPTQCALPARGPSARDMLTGMECVLNAAM